jgi:hypothetical protein
MQMIQDNEDSGSRLNYDQMDNGMNVHNIVKNLYIMQDEFFAYSHGSRSAKTEGRLSVHALLPPNLTLSHDSVMLSSK